MWSFWDASDLCRTSGSKVISVKKNPAKLDGDALVWTAVFFDWIEWFKFVDYILVNWIDFVFFIIDWTKNQISHICRFDEIFNNPISDCCRFCELFEQRIISHSWRFSEIFDQNVISYGWRIVRYQLKTTPTNKKIHCNFSQIFIPIKVTGRYKKGLELRIIIHKSLLSVVINYEMM